MITTPIASFFRRAASKLRMVFFETTHRLDQTIEQIIAYATKARRNGIVSLETGPGQHWRSISAERR